MAVTAKFAADFQSFFVAVQKADTQLKSFEQDANKVQRSLNRMTDGLSGRRVIQEAALMSAAVDKIGGVSKLTSNELRVMGDRAREASEKMQRLGIDVPPQLARIQRAAEDAARPQMWDRVTDGLRSFGSTARSIGTGLTFGLTAPIVAAAGAVVKFGIDAVESENLVSVSFGDMKKSADDWSKQLSKSLGLNEFELRKQAGTLFNMTTSMGLGRKAAFDMSTGIAKLAADMASFRNIGIDEALTKLRAGLVGETEPLKAIGILVDEATVKTEAYRTGIAKQGAELTQQQKVMARYSAILRQTANDQGDLARTIDSPANQLRVLRTRLEESATALGISLMPLIQQATTFLSGLAPKIQDAVKWFTELPGPVKNTALAIGGIAAAAGPAVYVLGSLAGAAADLIPLMRTLAGINVAGALAKLGTGAALGVVGGTLFAGGAIAIHQFNQNLAELDARMKSANEPAKDLQGNIKWTIDAAKAAGKIDNKPLAAGFRLSAEQVASFRTALAGPNGANEALAQSDKELEKAAKAAAKAADDFHRFASSIEHVGRSLSPSGIDSPIRGLKELGAEALFPLQAVREEMSAINADIRGVARGIEDANFDLFIADIERVEAALKDLDLTPGRLTGPLPGVKVTDAIDMFPKLKPRSLSDSLKSLAGGDVGAVFGDLKKFFTKGAGDVAKGFLQGLGNGLLQGGLNLVVSGVTKLFGAIFGESEGSKTRKMRRDFIEAAGGIKQLSTEAYRANFDLDRLFNTRKIKEFEAETKKLQEALEFAAESEKFLNDTIKEFGLEGNLPQGVATKRMNDQAADLLRKYTALKGASFDLTEVLKKMFAVTITTAEDGTRSVTDWGTGFADLVQKARQAGIALPNELKKIVNDAIAMGLVVDESGKAFASAEEAGITFAGSLEDAIGGLIGTLEKLEETLRRVYSLEQPDIPVDRIDSISEVGRIPGFLRNRAAAGGLVTARGIQRFFGGGLVGAMGTDTVPAMLTPGEMVLNANQQRAVGSLLRRGAGGGGQGIVQIILDGRVLTSAVVKFLPGEAQRYVPRVA